jgi:hypothetical protein
MQISNQKMIEVYESKPLKHKSICLFLRMTVITFLKLLFFEHSNIDTLAVYIQSFANKL